MRRTKIVATLGPASESADGLRRLIQGGVDVFRLNFSYGPPEKHARTIRRIRRIARDMGRDIAILQDLCGPKIRVGTLRESPVMLTPRRTVRIVERPVKGSAETFSTTYTRLAHDVQPGARVLLADGSIELRVLTVENGTVTCRVVRGGALKSDTGINLPGTQVSAPSVTPADMRALTVGLRAGVDFVALSFVRHPDDIRKIRRAVKRRGQRTQIIAKIEKPEAVAHIDGILAAADGIMVARGDLGVEMDLARVAVIQKDLIRRANEQDRYVITATQMLESMTHNEMPTRAEVSDVANAILDGTDAVMFSGETAVGVHPARVVSMADRIARETEAYIRRNPPDWDWVRISDVNPVQEALGEAAMQLSAQLNVSAVVAFSATGGTALYLSKSRPTAPIVAFTRRREAARRMRLFWGVLPIYDPSVRSRADLLKAATKTIRERGIARRDNRILLVAGTHFGQVGATNAIEVLRLP